MSRSLTDLFTAIHGIVAGLPPGAHRDLLHGLTIEVNEVTENLLTDPERRALDLLAATMNIFAAEIVADGPTRSADLNEFAMGIHRLQHVIMAQAAARAYPDTFRLLGRTIEG